MDEIDFDANQTYEEFLEKHVADKSQKIYSHQSLCCKKIKYAIKVDEYPTFLDLYHGFAFENNGDVYLSEKHADIGPVIIDLDFKHDYIKGNKTRCYNNGDFLEIFLTSCMAIMTKYFNIQDDVARYAFVLEKKNKQKMGEMINGKVKISHVKDGLHIIFPYIVSIPRMKLIYRYELL